MTRIARTLRITGRVQGVAYRAWTRGQAQALGLDGWVTNRDDGSVEALVGGAEPDVDAIVTACWQGPGAAEVREVQVAPADPATLPQGFEILR